MINFIFFGRLESSKGIDLIIDFILDYSGFCREKGFNFYIFGDGSFDKQVAELDKKFDFVNYFGWQTKEVIKKYLRIADFTLMPSRFLETFGLSALESLAEGVPVIGFKKGGLRQFIFDEFDLLNNHKQFLSQLQTMNNGELKVYNGKIYKFSDKFLFNSWFLNNNLWDKWNYELKQYYKEKCLELAKKYSVEKWLENFLKITGQ